MGLKSELRENLGKFRQRLYRSNNAKILGVFSGIAESLGFSVCWTRIVGVICLLGIAGSAGADGLRVHILVSGFFYLLMAMLMQPPRKRGLSGDLVQENEDGSMPSPTPFWKRDRASGVPSYQASRPPPARVDLMQLDRQLDGLNRRIQRMETIVTDRQYDWDRRMDR